MDFELCKKLKEFNEQSFDFSITERKKSYTVKPG